MQINGVEGDTIAQAVRLYEGRLHIDIEKMAEQIR